MVTAWSGDVSGQLLRWVWDDGEVGYEARIDGLDENGGFSNAAAPRSPTAAISPRSPTISATSGRSSPAPTRTRASSGDRRNSFG